jgi:hypothetical protein
MMVGSIPKEWLSRIPQKRIHELVDKRQARENLENEIKRFYGVSDIPRRLLDNKRLELTSGDRLANKLDFEARTDDNEGRLADAIDLVTRESKKPDYFGVGDVGHDGGLTPYGLLSDALGRLGDNLIGRKAFPYGTQAYDVISGKVRQEGGIPAWDINPAMGAITKGMMPPPKDIRPKDRLFNWDVYNTSVARGDTPRQATRQAQPLMVLNPDADRMFEFSNKIPSNGHISNAYPSNNIFGNWSKNSTWVGTLKDIAEHKDNTRLNYFLTHGLTGPWMSDETGISPVSASKILDFIATGKSDLTKSLRQLNPKFRTRPGAIGRGNALDKEVMAKDGFITEGPKPLPEWFKEAYEDNLSDVEDWKLTAKTKKGRLKEAQEQSRYGALEQLKDELKYRSSAGDEESIPKHMLKINPFEHLRDVSTPK